MHYSKKTTSARQSDWNEEYSQKVKRSSTPTNPQTTVTTSSDESLKRAANRRDMEKYRELEDLGLGHIIDGDWVSPL